MIKYEKTIADLILTFSASALRYTHICERLVQPLMLDPQDFSDLINDPLGGSWKSQEFGNRVKQSLDKDYATFIGIAARLNERLMRFASNLDLDPANNLRPKWLSQPQTSQARLRDRFFSRSNKIFKGLKPGFENGSLEKVLQQIEEDLRRLKWLLDGRDRERPMRKQKMRSGQAMVWNNIRAAARSIYTALAAHWQYSSTHHHAVSLRLETRKDAIDDQNIRFGLILDLEHGAASPQQMVTHNVEIEPKTTVSPAQPQTRPATLGSFKISSLSVTPQVQVMPAPTPSSQIISGTHIQDLCGWQQNFQYTNQDKFGFLQHDVWQYDLYPGKLAHHVSSPLSHLSLHDCLTGVRTGQTHAPLFAPGLGPREK